MLLQLKNLTITHKKDLRCLLSDFSFVLNEGDIAVIVGEEGNGKSTLLKLIYDEGLVAPYAEWSGEIIRGGSRFGYLSQELEEDEAALGVREYLAALPGFVSLNPRERRALAEELDIDSALLDSARPLSSLSGGERVKLRLLGVMASQPDALLLDEPTGDLDLDALEWLESYIPECGVPVLFVSHDETLIERTANTVIHLELLRRKTLPRATVARLPYRDYIEARLGALSRQGREAAKEREEFEAKLSRFRRIQQKVEHAQAAISRGDPHGSKMLKRKMHAVKSMGRRYEKEREKLTAAPETEEAIFLRFPADAAVPRGKTVLDMSLPVLCAGERVLARDVALRVVGPERVCIVGRNGAGKSTLLRLIAEELSARRDIRAGYMPQDYAEALPFDKTPVEFLNLSGGRAEEERLRAFLGSLRYTTDEMERPAGELSGGQKAKLLLVKLALSGCNVLLLDEPTRNFSPLSAPVIRELLRAYGGAVISVSHDRRFISQVCGTVYTLTGSGLTRIWGE